MFWTAVRGVYVRAWKFLWALPLIGAVIVGVEAAQHVVEWQSGMYASKQGLADAAHDPVRLIVGSVKVLWLLVIQYWVVRYFVSGSREWAVRAEPVAFRRFSVILAVAVATSLPTIWLPELLPADSAAQANLARNLAFGQLATLPLGIALIPWIVGAALGDPRANPLFALRRAWGSIWWGMGVAAVTVLPPMVAHYALSFAAIERPPILSIPLLAIDVFVVGYLGVLVAGHAVPIAARMAAQKGDTLSK